MGVSWAQPGHFPRLAFIGADLHHLLPVVPDPIADEHGDRRTQCLAMSNAAEELRVVLFQLLALRPAVSELAAAKVAGDVFLR